MPMSNRDNVPSDSPTEKYRGAVGTPVQSDPEATFGATKGATFPSNDVTTGGVGTPVKRD
jgi:hypothetical protein